MDAYTPGVDKGSPKSAVLGASRTIDTCLSKDESFPDLFQFMWNSTASGEYNPFESNNFRRLHSVLLPPALLEQLAGTYRQLLFAPLSRPPFSPLPLPSTPLYTSLHQKLTCLCRHCGYCDLLLGFGPHTAFFNKNPNVYSRCPCRTPTRLPLWNLSRNQSRMVFCR